MSTSDCGMLSRTHLTPSSIILSRDFEVDITLTKDFNDKGLVGKVMMRSDEYDKNKT